MLAMLHGLTHIQVPDTASMLKLKSVIQPSLKKWRKTMSTMVLLPIECTKVIGGAEIIQTNRGWSSNIAEHTHSLCTIVVGGATIVGKKSINLNS